MEATKTAKQEPATAYLALHRGNARFFPSAGGLLALSLLGEDGEIIRTYERVIVKRCFPLTSPNDYLSVREPTGAQTEIGIIPHLTDLDEQEEELLRRELAVRYFVPKITKVMAVHRRRAFFLDVETDLGIRKLKLRDPTSSIRVLDDGRIFFTDVDGNSFEIPDPKALDKKSFRLIEVFL